jgi:glutamyl-tRNA reductase
MRTLAAESNSAKFFVHRSEETTMSDFDRKMGEASARVNKSVAEATERVEKETAEFIKYLNDEVVPAVREHSTKALRVASEKLARLADYMDQNRPK